MPSRQEQPCKAPKWGSGEVCTLAHLLAAAKDKQNSYALRCWFDRMVQVGWGAAALNQS